MTSKHKSIILLVSLVFCSACLNFSSTYQSLCQQTHHDLVNNAYGKLLWSIQDIYTFDTGNGPLLAASSGKLFVVANTASFPGPNLLSYDTVTGNFLWHRSVDLPMLLAVNDGKIYQGRNDVLDVLDGLKGNLLEEIPLPQAGEIVSLYQIGDKFYIYGSSGRFIVFDNSVKKIVMTTEPNFIEQTLLTDDDITYSHTVNRLVAFNGKTSTMVWQTEIDGSFSDAVFQNDMIFLSVGSPIYTSSIYAINRSTGAVVWKKDINVISNIEPQNSELYVLTLDGYLTVLDQQTGQEVNKMQFTAVPFLLNDSQTTSGGYYISADIENKIIVASLGDSCQLMAIKLQNQ